MRRDVCGWFQIRLPLLAGDDLAGLDRRQLERHLVGCPDCRGRFEALRATLAVLHAAAGSSPVAADAPSLWPALDRQIRESRRQAQAWPHALVWSTAGLAASLLVAAGALLLMRADARSAPRPVANAQPSSAAQQNPADAPPVLSSASQDSPAESPHETLPFRGGNPPAQADATEAQPTR